MNLRKLALISSIAICTVALAGCKKAPAVSNTNSGANQASGSSAADEKGAVVITYDGTGFNPASATIKVGQKVVVKNTSSSAMSFNSDPHPTHTLFPELNLGPIAAGSSKSFTISKAGAYSYHNHLNASQKGTIVVE